MASILRGIGGLAAGLSRGIESGTDIGYRYQVLEAQKQQAELEKQKQINDLLQTIPEIKTKVTDPKLEKFLINRNIAQIVSLSGGSEEMAKELSGLISSVEPDTASQMVDFLMEKGFAANREQAVQLYETDPLGFTKQVLGYQQEQEKLAEDIRHHGATERLEGARVGLEGERVGLEKDRLKQQADQFRQTQDLDERQFAFDKLKEEANQRLEQLKVDLQARGLSQKDMELRMTAARDAFDKQLKEAAQKLDIKRYDLDVSKFDEEKRAAGVAEGLETRKVEAEELRTLAQVDNVNEPTLKFLLGSRAKGNEVKHLSKDLQDQINNMSPEQADQVLKDMEGAPLVSIGAGETELDKAAAKRVDESIRGIDTRADAATDIIQSADVIRHTLEQGTFEPGFLPGIREQIGQVADMVGLDPSSLPLIGNPDDAAVVRAQSAAIATKLAADLADKQLNKTQTEFVKDQAPNLTMSREGLLLLNELAIRNAERDIQLQKIKDDFLATRGGEFTGAGAGVKQEVELNKTLREAAAALEKADPILSPDLMERIRKVAKPNLHGGRAGPKAVIIE